MFLLPEGENGCTSLQTTICWRTQARFWSAFPFHSTGIAPNLRHLWWVSASRKHQECFCKTQSPCLRSAPGKKNKKNKNQPDQWEEWFTTSLVAFWGLWMIVTENTVWPLLQLHTGVMWWDVFFSFFFFLNWKCKWEICGVRQLLNNESFVSGLMIHGDCFCCRDSACWLTLNCAAGEETLT